ncbi:MULTISPECIES: DUF1206 domain-containing protein [Kocuria]|uniref:DUF1206 domain-containing protein n=1 Tax=Kocuria TaxID=57493 RepID=UPI002040D2D1|nr:MULTISPECIES: DUF1206 domain-containing protein [Kocuria]MCM3687225.1 DUF1206 domain-containing protein [Kocuria rosea]HST73222.1 DUF1206 domain-containing protein [Kocuria rosea]
MGEVGREVGRAADAAESVTDSPGFVAAARAGYAASGLLHLMIGVIALRIASGGSGSADQSGAVAQLARTPGGGLLLWACFLGCAALALFLLSKAVVSGRRHGGKDRAKQVLKEGGQAVVYGAVGATFGVHALGGTSSSSGSAGSLTARLMANPGGAALLIAVGAGILVGGGYFVYRGVTATFLKNLQRLPPGRAGTAVKNLGKAGYVAKGIALGLLGALVVVATVQHDPQESTGLDGALKSLQQQPYGVWMLGAVAVGLICYGLFMVVRAKYQRM